VSGSLEAVPGKGLDLAEAILQGKVVSLPLELPVPLDQEHVVPHQALALQVLWLAVDIPNVLGSSRS